MTETEVDKIMSRIKFELSKATEKTLFGRKYTTKKIKRRLYYDVSFYYDGKLQSHYFESAKKMRRFVDNIHELLSSDIPVIRIKKTWCYREHSPRRQWHYVSEYPGSYVCVERW